MISGKITGNKSFKVLLSTIIIVCNTIFISFSQNSNKSGKSHPNVHKVVVDSVLHTTSYTYLLVDEENKMKWLAIPRKDVYKDEIYYYQGGMEMKDFKSKELNRIFTSILFLQGVVSPDELEGGKKQLETSKSNTTTPEINIVTPENGITIGELYLNKKKYENKIVKVRGQVTKYNPGIMSRNWIHLKDGSENSSGFDFTATSVMETKEGEVITIEGKIVLDKDFGSGYFFNVLMEDGKIVK